MSDGLMDKLFDAVEAAELETADDFVGISLAMLAVAIHKLPPEEREAMLRAIEDGGALRRAVAMHPATRQLQEAPIGYLN
jgi:hypothetical protein